MRNLENEIMSHSENEIMGVWGLRVLMTVVFISHFLISSFSQSPSPQQWRDSVSTLMEAIAKDPKNTDLRLKKAEANINLQQWEYAVEEYGNVLRIDNRNLAALYFRAFCHTQLRHYDLAKVDYESFLAIEPVHLEARLGLAHVLRKIGHKTETVDELNRIVQMFPDSADAYAARAAYETEEKQYDIALYDWDEAIRRRPDNADFVVSKVDILIRLGKRNDALEVLDNAVKRGTPRGALKEWYDQLK